MTKWQYAVIRIPDNSGQPMSEDDIAHVCNVKGGFGWEMVSVVREDHASLCFFKLPSEKDYDAVMEDSRKGILERR